MTIFASRARKLQPADGPGDAILDDIKDAEEDTDPRWQVRAARKSGYTSVGISGSGLITGRTRPQ
jgi:hypothetical protein